MPFSILPDSLDSEPPQEGKKAAYIAAGLPESVSDKKKSNSFVNKLIDRAKYTFNDPQEGWRRTEEDLLAPMEDIVNDNVSKDNAEYEDLLKWAKEYDKKVNHFPQSFIITNRHSNNLKSGKYDKIQYLKKLKETYEEPLP